MYSWGERERMVQIYTSGLPPLQMRLRSRHIRGLSLALLTLLTFCLLRAALFGAPEAQLTPFPLRAANDGVLDELLDEAFTRPGDRGDGKVVVIDAGHLPSGVLRFGLVDRRSSPLCPAGPLQAPVSGRVRTFQALVDTGDLPPPLFLYSAFVECERETSESARLTVRVLAFMERSFHAGLFCQLWFRNGPRPLSLLPARRLPLAEPGVASLLEAVELQCLESDVRPPDAGPYAVSIVAAASLCDPPVNVLPTLLAAPPRTVEPSGVPPSFAVCCATPLSAGTDPNWLLEWLEAQRLFGAGRVFLYLLKGSALAPSPAVFRVLRAFSQRKGLVTALDWPILSAEQFDSLWPREDRRRQDVYARQGRLLAANDCLRRLSVSGQHRFAVISDLHELLVPNPPFSDWPALFLRQSSPPGYRLRAAKVQFASQEEREAMAGSTLNLTVRMRSSRLSPPGEDANFVLDPARVAAFGADGSLRLRSGSPSELVNISEEEALVFSYDAATRLTDSQAVIDERLAHISYPLMSAVTMTREAMKRN